MATVKNLKKRLLGDAAIAFLGRFLIILLALGISSFAARNIPMEAAGWFFFILSVATFASLLGRFGLDTAALRLVAERRSLENPNVAWAVFAQVVKRLLLQSFSIGILLALSIRFYSDLSWLSCLLAGALGFTLAIQFFLSEALRGFEDIKLAVILGGLTTNAFALFAMFFCKIFSEELVSLEFILSLMVAAGGLNCIAAIFLVRKYQPDEAAESDISAREIGKISHFLGLRACMAFVLMNADLWILSYFVSGEQLAVYGAVSRLMFVTSFALQIINIVVSPLIAKLHVTDDRAQLETILRGTAAVGLVPTLLLAGLFLTFGAEILSLVFGESYRSGYIILLILIGGRVANALTGSCGYALMMTGGQRYVFTSVTLVTTCTVLASIPITAIYGAVGTAAVFSLGLFSQQLSLAWGVKKRLGIYSFASFQKMKECFF